MSSEWHDTVGEKPSDGQMVEVPNNGGVRLLYKGGLWWLPDGSMYVYYVPQYWKAVEQPCP